MKKLITSLISAITNIIYKNVNIYNLIQLYFLLLHHRLKDYFKGQKILKPESFKIS